MDAETLIMLVSNLGVPSVLLGFVGYYVIFLQKEIAKERKSMQMQDHQNDLQLVELVKASNSAILELKVALSEQTTTMRDLLAKLDKKRK
jgi:hypothetical protein